MARRTRITRKQIRQAVSNIQKRSKAWFEERHVVNELEELGIIRNSWNYYYSYVQGTQRHLNEMAGQGKLLKRPKPTDRRIKQYRLPTPVEIAQKKVREHGTSEE